MRDTFNSIRKEKGQSLSDACADLGVSHTMLYRILDTRAPGSRRFWTLMILWSGARITPNDAYPVLLARASDARPGRADASAHVAQLPGE